MAKNSTSGWIEEHKNYILPSALGGVVAWGFSSDLTLGLMVFFAVWAGNWFAFSLRGKK